MKKYIYIFILGITSVNFLLFSKLSAYSQDNAKNYLIGSQKNPWVIMGLSVLSENPDITFLKNFFGTSAIDYTAPILAITATNNDPKTFPNENFVNKLKSFEFENQLGDKQSLNDDIFGILALISAGENINESVIQNSKNFLTENQKENGGWGFSVSSTPDSNTTASALLALKGLGFEISHPVIEKALNFLKTAQNTDGGFAYDPESEFGKDSDSSSTAWVLWALNAFGIDPSTWTKNENNPIEYLTSTQTEQGFFEWQKNSGENSFSPTNTAFAAIALEGKTLPLKILDNSQKEYSFRIEGLNETVCEGKTQGPTALDIIKNSSKICNFTYSIKETSFGPYLEKINGDMASGQAGWLYWVNYKSPSIGALDYYLKESDEILWAFGNFDIKPTKISLSKIEILENESTTATLEYFNQDNSAPVNAGTIVVGNSEFITNSNGKAEISTAPGFYKVYGMTEGFVRSNKVLLKSGSPTTNSLNLSVNIKGSALGTSTQPSQISFTINPNSIDFGNLNPGTTGIKNISIQNTGTVDIFVEPEVSGSSIFKDYLQISENIWSKFKKLIPQNENIQVVTKLPLPNNAQKGLHTGAVIFWASPKTNP